MRWYEALEYLKEKSKNATSREVSITLDDIHGVLLRAGTSDGDRWAAKIETVVTYVEAGNYAFCYPEAMKILNKRNYKIKS